MNSITQAGNLVIAPHRRWILQNAFDQGGEVFRLHVFWVRLVGACNGNEEVITEFEQYRISYERLASLAEDVQVEIPLAFKSGLLNDLHAAASMA